jgi:hypothetical protein
MGALVRKRGPIIDGAAWLFVDFGVHCAAQSDRGAHLGEEGRRK